jgi:transposase-like protein
LTNEEDTFVERSHNKYYQAAKDFFAECPTCKSKEVSIRKRKKPKYVCKGCGNEFDDPKANIAYKSPKQKDDFGKHYSNADE